MNTHCYELTLRVLICKEGERFAAHALELDIFGYGDSEKEALRDLQEAITAQLSFADQMTDPGMIFRPAPKAFFDRWDKAHLAALRGTVCKDTVVKLNAKAVSIPIDTQPKSRTGSKFTRDKELAIV